MKEIWALYDLDEILLPAISRNEKGAICLEQV